MPEILESNALATNLAFSQLSPDEVLNTVDALGFRPDGRLLALNSYENRVYRIGIQDGDSLIAKFYRPQRWSDDTILEEHTFCFELAEQEVPVVAPLRINQRSLHHHNLYRLAIFPNHGGRIIDLENYDSLTQLGRFIGRIHLIGKSHSFKYRPHLNIKHYGTQSIDYLLNKPFLPKDLLNAYRTLCQQIITQVEHCYQRAGEVHLIRSHADCHPSNILWDINNNTPHIVDFDDCRMAPQIQDLWMFISGNRNQQALALDALLEGYTQFYDFDYRQLHLIEALRSLRLIHYYAWLAKRWDDPAFQHAFPWFNTQQCWEQHILDLREQYALMQEPPLSLHR